MCNWCHHTHCTDTAVYRINSLTNVHHSAPTFLGAPLNWGMKPWRRNMTGLMSVIVPAAATRPATSCRCVPSGAGTHWCCLDVRSFRTSPCMPLLQQQANKYISLSHKAFRLCSGYCWYFPLKIIYFCSSHLSNTKYLFFCTELCRVCSNSSIAHSTASSPAKRVLCVNSA